MASHCPMIPMKWKCCRERAPRRPRSRFWINIIQALGGAQALAKLTSFTAKGTYEGFDSDFGKVPVDIYAKAPDLRATIVHMIGGDATSTCDAWLAAPGTLAPVPLIPLAGADLGGARLDARLSFPGQIKQVLTDWRA
jgi:hypothetical protein